MCWNRQDTTIFIRILLMHNNIIFKASCAHNINKWTSLFYHHQFIHKHYGKYLLTFGPVRGHTSPHVIAIMGTMTNPTQTCKGGIRGPSKDGLENLHAHFEYIGYSQKNDKSPWLVDLREVMNKFWYKNEHFRPIETKLKVARQQLLSQWPIDWSLLMQVDLVAHEISPMIDPIVLQHTQTTTLNKLCA
jgi:hypothetical protein